MSLLLILSTAAGVAAETTIVVTAARTPVAREAAPVSVTVLDEPVLRGLELPAAADLLRLTPGVSVSTSGPRGSQTQLRIRGAEANHTLLFLDGIRLNDPAAGNEPRFELLTSDPLSRIEVVRGPQSALWGSEAIGGVIAAQSADPFGGTRASLLGEYGSFDTLRLSGQGSVSLERAGLSAAATHQSSEGIDSFGADGERDGFDLTTFSLRGEVRPVDGLRVGLTGHVVEGSSAFDGSDPVTFRRANTLDATDNSLGALRGFVEGRFGGWTVTADTSYLASENRNRLGNGPLNRTEGERLTFGGQVSRALSGHMLTAAVEHEREDFRARDTVYFGGTDQDRSRERTAFVGQWRAEWSDMVTTDLAMRHDDFSTFEDATTVRGALLVRPAAGWTLHASYGEGIAQPTFYDLFGFFPNSFRGNPDLRPERSEGWEAGVRWESGRARIGATVFAATLTDEIVGTFDPVTFLAGVRNADGESERRGLEIEGAFAVADWLQLGANYTYLDADEPRVAGGNVRESRRPEHSGNLFATGTIGRFRLGASLSYVGERTDTNFDVTPSKVVTLDDYALASVRIAYDVLPGVELYARAENAFDATYQDVVGYATPRASVHAGLRLRLGR